MLHSRSNEALVIHEDDELSELIGVEVVSRETIREWPLSWSQKIELADGRVFAYKSHLPPMVEMAFNAACDSPLLPAHQVLGLLGECGTLLVEWIDSPSLAEMNLSLDDVVRHGRAVVDQIGTITGDLPVYLDVGTPEKWTAEADVALEKLRQVIADRRFRNLVPDIADRLASWASSQPVLERIETDSRLVQRDIKLEHIFPIDGGYKIIDWGVPAIAPAGVDLVALLKEGGVGALPYVDAETYDIALFLQLRWAIVAQHDIFPAFPNQMFEWWASEASAALLRG